MYGDTAIKSDQAIQELAAKIDTKVKRVTAFCVVLRFVNIIVLFESVQTQRNVWRLRV